MRTRILNIFPYTYICIGDENGDYTSFAKYIDID